MVTWSHDVLSGCQLTNENVHATMLDITRCPDHKIGIRSFLSAGLAPKSLEIRIGYIRHPSSDLA